MAVMDFRAKQASSKRTTLLLLAGMGSVLAFAIWAMAYSQGITSIGIVPIAVGVALVSTWGSYYGSDKIVLRMTGAKVVDSTQAPQLINLVEEMCLASGLPMPKVAIINDPAPNAFATGRDPEHAVIAFTTGILQAMDREQLQGVVAHELAHVANRDTLVSAVTATTVGAIALLSDLALRISMGGSRRSKDSNGIVAIIAILGIVLAPIAAMLLQLAVSRKREALADQTAVAFTRNPAGLRRALETLASDSTVVAQRSQSMAHLWIESPLDGAKTSKLFNTHPPITERIEALRQMETSAE